MNASTKNSQMKHCPCPKYGIIYRPDLTNSQVKQKHLKNDQKLKFTLYSTTKSLLI